MFDLGLHSSSNSRRCLNVYTSLILLHADTIIRYQTFHSMVIWELFLLWFLTLTSDVLGIIYLRIFSSSVSERTQQLQSLELTNETEWWNRSGNAYHFLEWGNRITTPNPVFLHDLGKNMLKALKLSSPAETDLLSFNDTGKGLQVKDPL